MTVFFFFPKHQKPPAPLSLTGMGCILSRTVFTGNSLKSCLASVDLPNSCPVQEGVKPMRAHMITWFGASFLATVLGTGCQQQSLRNDFEVQSPPAAAMPNLSASVTSQRPPRNSETALPPAEPASPVRGTVVRVEFAEPDAASQAAAAAGLSD